MTYNEGQLLKIHEYGTLLLRTDEIGYLLSLDINQVKNDLENKFHEAHNQYMQGKLETKLILRENLIKNAKRGSPIAEQILNELAK